MGLTYSSNLRIELYKWSSPEFPEEYALTYTSLNDESKFSIFRLSVNREKVLCRLADSLCHEHPVRLHMEVIAERDNNGDCNYRVVRVVEAGTSQRQIPLRDGVNFGYVCEKRSCSFEVTRHTGLMLGSWENLTWNVSHWYNISNWTKTITFNVNIKCDKVTGLSAKFRNPSKYDGLFSDEEQPGSLIHREVNGEPPKHVSAIVESMFIGKQFILLKQGKGNSLTYDEDGKMVVINNSGNFYGNANGCFT